MFESSGGSIEPEFDALGCAGGSFVSPVGPSPSDATGAVFAGSVSADVDADGDELAPGVVAVADELDPALEPPTSLESAGCVAPCFCSSPEQAMLAPVAASAHNAAREEYDFQFIIIRFRSEIGFRACCMLYP